MAALLMYKATLGSISVSSSGLLFGCAITLFSYVLSEMWRMAASALRIKDLGGEIFQLPSMRLKVFLMAAIGSWLFFPSAIFSCRAGLLEPATAERVLLYANFVTKV